MEVFTEENDVPEGVERGEFPGATLFKLLPTRSIGHWPYYYHRQLRYGLCFASPTYLYINQSSRIMCYNTATNLATEVLNVEDERKLTKKVYDYGYKNDWRIICIKVIEKYLVFSATNGIIFVLDRENDHSILWKGTVGNASINSISGHRYGEELRLLICCNEDTGLYVYRLPDMELIKKLAVPNEESALFVNDVAISEDGKWLVAVGDARDIWIYDVSDGEYTYRATLPCVIDEDAIDSSGFNMVRWDRDGRFFACASEGGCAVVFSAPEESEEFQTASVATLKPVKSNDEGDDMELVLNDNGKRARESTDGANAEEGAEGNSLKRKKVQVKSIQAKCQYFFWNAERKQSLAKRMEGDEAQESEEEQDMRKVRTVQFTSDDLLIFTESVKHVHVVDMRNKVQQVLQIPSMTEPGVPEVHGNIAGVAVSPDGRHLYVSLLKDWNSREGYILEYERSGAPSLREITIKYIQANREYWNKQSDFSWDQQLPDHLVTEIAAPFGGIDEFTKVERDESPFPLPTNETKRANLLILRNYFKRKKWVFTQEGPKAIGCGLALKSCNIDLLFLFRKKSLCMIVRNLFVARNESRVLAISQALLEINSSLVLGAFTRDMMDGTVRFRMEIPVVNNLLTFKQLDHCVMTTIYAIDMYYPKLMKILWDEAANVKQILSQDS